MWHIARIVIIGVVLGYGSLVQAADKAIQYEVALIRGTDSDRAPETANRRASADWVSAFRCVLKWRNYWEICRRNVVVATDRKLRVALSNEREVEIDLTATGKRTVTAFQRGQIIDRIIGPRGEVMSLIGGNRDRTNGWFIVVRRQHSEATQGI